MNRAKMIKKIIGEAIDPLGFYYKGASRDGNGTDYVFEKKKGSSRVMVGKKYPQPQCLC